MKSSEAFDMQLMMTRRIFNDEIQKEFSDIDRGDIFTLEEVQIELLKCRRG